MEIEPIFTENIYATYGEAGKTWLNQLPIHLESLSKLWDFRFIRPVPNLSYNFVGLVELNSNREVVILKTAPQDGNIVLEARWLKSFKKGVPHIFNIDEKRNAFLMERLEPGETLTSLIKKGQDETATRIISQTILELQFEQPALLPCKHISELSEALPILNGHLENSLLSKALSLFHDLSADRNEDILLHGDLHHDNILQSGSSWKAIDPHGYIGDRTAEIGAMIYNPLDCFPNDRPLKKVIETRLKILSEMLPFDPQRIRAWAFCWTLLSAAWDIEGYGKILQNKAEIAQILDKV